MGNVAALPADRTDIQALARTVQSTLQKLTQLEGAGQQLPQIQLSPLESEDELSPVTTLASLSQQAAALRAQLSDVLNLVEQQQQTIQQLAQDLAIVISQTVFANLPSLDFNDSSWSDFVGVAARTALGDEFDNTPFALTDVDEYYVTANVLSDNGYRQLVYIQGPSEQRVFIRAGTSFSNAIARGWKEL